MSGSRSLLSAAVLTLLLGLVGALAAPPATAPTRLAEAGAEWPSRDWFVGAWVTRNVEFGQDIEIVWTLYDDGRLAYLFILDGEERPGSEGTWHWDGERMTERWIRDGGWAEGIARIERIDDDTLRLFILDNGHDEYRGMVRIYRRRAPKQVSEAGPE